MRFIVMWRHDTEINQVGVAYLQWFYGLKGPFVLRSELPDE